ncbi:hypothetical protein V6N13_133686 [Hibiscus sabdariffa]
MSDAISSRSNVFKIIFDDVSEPDVVVSFLFSNDNPFKRKPIESVLDPKNVYSLDSSAPILKHEKQKEKVEISILGSSEEATEVQKSKKGRNSGNLNLGSLDDNAKSSACNSSK